MSKARPFLVSLLACPALVLTGSLAPPAAPSAAVDRPTLAPADGSMASARAAGIGPLELLDRAAVLLAPERVQWLEMNLWQRVECADLCYQAEGRFVAAPGQRRALRLRIQVGGTQGQVHAVSDGRKLWQMSQVGSENPAVSLVDLPAVPAGQGAAASPLCQAVLQQYGIHGLAALLSNIRLRLQRPRREIVLWGGREVIRISGEWPLDPARKALLPRDLPTSSVPRRCRVYLEARTLWPLRVEWWGAEADGTEGLLSQTEFRDPVVNKPLSPARCAQEFVRAPA